MILLFGGGGFLGSHIRQAIRTGGRKELCTLVTRSEPGGALSENEEWLPAQGFMEASPAAQQAIRTCRVVVYAATSSIRAPNELEPWRELQTNVAPATQIFDLIGRLNPALRILYLSSGGTVYGNSGLSGPIPEDHPTRPISAYAFGATLIEQALAFVTLRTGNPYSILRVANPIGTYQGRNGHGLVPAVFRAVRQGRPVPVFGDGGNMRDYFDADDLARAVLMAAADTSGESRTWNVGSGTGRTILDMLEVIGAVTGKRVEIEPHPARPTDVRSIVLDCSRIERDLGWQPTTPIEESIRRMWVSTGEEDGTP